MKKPEGSIELQHANIFASRDTIEEAMEYMQSIVNVHPDMMAVMLPTMVLYNTIAKNFYLVPKDNH